MRRAALFATALALVASACTQPTKPGEGTGTTAPVTGLPARPAGWPATFQIGMADDPDGAAALRASVPMAFRYQYLAGGANTGNGWATWNAGGEFARYYIDDSHRAGMTPVFSYYMIRQSNPGASQGEVQGVHTNLNTPATMAAYYADLTLFFQKAKAAGGMTVLHVEPDLWGYLQQRSTNDDPATVPVRVGSSGVADVAGLPDNAAGFAQAVVRLRDRHAPNVLLAFHLSSWATTDDFLWSEPPDGTVDALGGRAGTFYNRLGARFDLAFMDLADRDAGFDQVIRGAGADAWFTAADYRRTTVFIGAFVRTARIRVALWQLPLGNTRMRAMNNTWDHFQDDKVEWYLDDPTGANLDALIRAGVVGLLFGRGADGATCACDDAGDGTTNPAAINGNNRLSLSADDDGGYFRERANAYYARGALAIP
jgi:hypothetical protein